MKILLINSSGSGYADYVDIAAGTTVSQLFGKHMPNCRAEDYLIRVNRQPVPADQVLQEADRVSIVANKIAGA